MWMVVFENFSWSSLVHEEARIVAADSHSGISNGNLRKICTLPQYSAEGYEFSVIESVLVCFLDAYAGQNDEKDQAELLQLDREIRNMVYAFSSVRNPDAWRVYWQARDDLVKSLRYKLGIFIEANGLRYDGGLRYEGVARDRRANLSEFEKLTPRLDQIKREFMAISSAATGQNLERLYQLDEELVALEPEIQAHATDATLLGYTEIGLVGRPLQYTRMLRQTADQLLPPQGFIDSKTGRVIVVKGDRYSGFKRELESIFQKYSALEQKPKDAERMYELSQALSQLIVRICKVYPYAQSQVFFKQEYEKMGLGIGHYSDQLEYDGQLAVRSYALNPDSRYAEETMLVAISGGEFPDVDMAAAYLKKFPATRHVRDIYWILASFHQDLFGELINGYEESVCYSEYFSTHPEARNRAAVRQKAISYYKKLAAIDSAERKRKYLNNLSDLEKGADNHVRYWCSD